ncbi:oxygenase MpaB family protein [Mycobacteroides chelonae]|uniref:oxygenase MpaB family protein n=1 Tax=Mycobacteroides chelonae TaxID=1774 RepID=UPI0009924647|nr:oxygenase MpaB family protein [Mycobacteroides chelonae]
MGSLRDDPRYAGTAEERRRRDRQYDFLLKLHGKNGRRALQIAEAPRQDDGYFGLDSLSFKVYENVMIAGMGALSGLFISTSDPDGAYGVGQHTTYYYDVVGRIRRSLLFFAGAVAGDTDAAVKVGRDLFRKHSHVNGEVPSTGESYRANHVETLKFTYVVGWPHLWRAYKQFGDPNATYEDECQFYKEQVKVCELMGMPAGELPDTPEGVEAWVQNAEKNLMAITRPAQELYDFLLHNPWTPLYPNAIMGVGVKLAIWAAIPLLTPYVREICDLETMRIRPAIGTFAIKGAVRALRNPIVEKLILPWFGYEMWGYMHNAIRHAPDTGPVPFDHEVGLKLQQGKGGTLEASACPMHAVAAARSVEALV